MTYAKFCRNGRIPPPAVVLLRDPYERLFSAFTYLKYGSELWHATDHHHMTNITFVGFVNAWAQPSHPRHSEVARSTTVRDWAHTPWVWADHFLPQEHWWGGCGTARPRFVCFSNDLVTDVARALHALNVTCGARRSAALNPTLVHNEKRPAEATLPAHTRAFLRSRYAVDQATYTRHCAPQRP